MNWKFYLFVVFFTILLLYYTSFKDTHFGELMIITPSLNSEVNESTITALLLSIYMTPKDQIALSPKDHQSLLTLFLQIAEFMKDENQHDIFISKNSDFWRIYEYNFNFKNYPECIVEIDGAQMISLKLWSLNVMSYYNDQFK